MEMEEGQGTRATWGSPIYCLRYYLSTPQDEWLEPLTPAMEMARDHVIDGLRSRKVSHRFMCRTDIMDRIDGKARTPLEVDNQVQVSVVEIVRPTPAIGTSDLSPMLSSGDEDGGSEPCG